MPHKARSFTALPGPDQTPVLLAKIATAPCPFAPATADAPLALYGGGNLGRLARDFLKAVGQDFVMAIDRPAIEERTRLVRPAAIEIPTRRRMPPRPTSA